MASRYAIILNYYDTEKDNIFSLADRHIECTHAHLLQISIIP